MSEEDKNKERDKYKNLSEEDKNKRRVSKKKVEKQKRLNIINKIFLFNSDLLEYLFKTIPLNSYIQTN